MKKLYYIYETSKFKSDIGLGMLMGDWADTKYEIYTTRTHYTAKVSVPDGCRYQIVSQSQLPPDLDNYSWDYSNYDGLGEQSTFTQSWEEYVTQSLDL